MAAVEQASLYFTEGGSDKEYHAVIEEVASGFVVNIAWGRRGSTLQTGTKTASPVEMEKAKKIFDKIVKEKMSKGYTTAEDGCAYQGSTDKEFTGHVPQLPNEIDEEEALRLIKDPAWGMQEKKDGRNIQLKTTGGKVIGINKKGLVCGIPTSFVEASLAISVDHLICGEGIGNVLHAFDLLIRAGQNRGSKPYNVRYTELKDLFPAGSTIQVVPLAVTTEEKRALYRRLKAEKREGVVFKRLDAPFTPGQPSSGGDTLKFKFRADASVVVIGINSGKRSVQVAVLDKGMEIPVGNVTIPPNKAIPAVGSIVDVKYLYAYPGGSLFQPVYLHERYDVERDECVVGRLKFKSTDSEDAEAA